MLVRPELKRERAHRNLQCDSPTPDLVITLEGVLRDEGLDPETEKLPKRPQLNAVETEKFHDSPAEMANPLSTGYRGIFRSPVVCYRRSTR